MVLVVVVVVVLGPRATMGPAGPLLVARVAGVLVPVRARSRDVAIPVVGVASHRPTTSMETNPVRAVGPPVQELHVFAKVGT